MENGSNLMLLAAWISQTFHLIQNNKPDISFWFTIAATVFTIVAKIMVIRREYRGRKKSENDN